MKLTLEFLEQKRAVVHRCDSPFVVVSWDRAGSFIAYSGAPDDLVELQYQFYSAKDSLDASAFAESLVYTLKKLLQKEDCITSNSIPFVW